MTRNSSPARARLTALLTLSLVGLLIGVSNFRAGASFTTPTRQAHWDRQDSSLSNPNNVGIVGVAYTPDSTKLVSLEISQSRVQIIEVATGTVLHTVTVESQPQAVVIDATGTYAYVLNAGSNSVSKVDIAAGTATTPILTVCSAASPHAMVIDPASTFIGVTCSNSWSDSGNELVIVSLSDYSKNVQTSSNPISSIVMHPSGAYVYVGSSWGDSTTEASTITRIGFPSGIIQGTIDVSGSGVDGVTALGINGAGTVLYVLTDDNPVIMAWTDLLTTPTKSWQTSLHFSPARNVFGIYPFAVDKVNNFAYFVMANVSWPEFIDVVDLSTGNISQISIEHQWARNIAVAPDGSSFILSGNRFSTLEKWATSVLETTTTTAATTTTTTTPTPDLPVLRIGRTVTLRGVATEAELAVPAGATVRLTVTPSSTDNCRVVTNGLRGVARGRCVVNVVVRRANGTSRSARVTYQVR